MDHKQMCVANVQYKKPTANEAKRAKGLLRYLTYRESRDEAAHYAAGRERWEDHGLGGSVAEIAQRCEALRSQHVLLFSLVYNVNPDLIAMVEPEQREQFVRELTVSTTEAFFEERGIDTGVEWSYVLHHRKTNDPQSPGQHDPHTHVVLPGTYYDDGMGERVPLYFSRNKSVDHIAMLHDLTERQVAEQMERYVGPDWERRYDELTAAREAQLAVTTELAHGVITEEEMTWDFWCGVRQTDEQTGAAGYYRYVPVGDEQAELQFRPLIDKLNHEEAELVAQLFRAGTSRDFNQLKQMADGIKSMNAGERADFFNELRALDLDRPNASHNQTGRKQDLDISF